MSYKPSAPDSAEERRQAPELTPEEARQGQIVLTTPARRWIFFGGLAVLLAGIVAVALAF